MKTFTKILAVIFGIFMIVGGVYCLFTPIGTYLVIGYVVGISMLIDAIGRFVFWLNENRAGQSDGWTLTSSILSAVFGILILSSAALQLGIDAFLIYYIAFWLIVQGIIYIVRANKIRRLHKNWDTKMLGTHWYLPLIIGILICVFGVLCLFMPLILASVIGVFIGLGIISAGASLISLAFTVDEN